MNINERNNILILRVFREFSALKNSSGQRLKSLNALKQALLYSRQTGDDFDDGTHAGVSLRRSL